MSDTTENTMNADPDAEQTAQAERAKILAKLKTQFFVGGERLEVAGLLIDELKIAGIDVKMNYVPAEIDFPVETHGLLIQVLKHRVNKKTVPTGEVLAAAVPTVDSVGNFGEAGEAFLMEAVEGILTSRVVNAVRAAKEGTDSFIPFSIEDFITKRTITSEFGDYNKISKVFVAALKTGKGFEILTPVILRNVLMSTEMASSIFPHIQQEWWEGVLAKMVEYCGKANPAHDASFAENWIATRDEVSSAVDAKELSLDALSLELEGSLSNDDDEEDGEEEDGDAAETDET